MSRVERAHSRLSPRALLLRVVVDTTETNKENAYWSKFRDGAPNGGFWGPYWENGKRFEYVPIPEVRTICNGLSAIEYLQGELDEKTYGNTKGMRLKKRLIQTINNMPHRRRKELKNIAIHNDPDFENLTYGDIKPTGSECAELENGDLLVFCASLQNCEKGVRARKGNQDGFLFIIGYFTVDACYDFERLNSEQRKKIVIDYKDKNAHFSSAYARSWGGGRTTQKELLDAYKRGDKDADRLILVVGKEGKSGLFKNAVRITEKYGNNHFYIPARRVKALHLNKSSGTHGRLLYNIGSKQINWNRNDKRSVKELKKILKRGKGFCHRRHRAP